eukprot:TRINITY_DN331_c0_g1_i7.p1 TRINITY_DN331_c0_g1~~TRINITY_DN331_c0_g1_i7.p1  ORF type:complete len:219 (-),score=60.89 TRINITY_DN331_c0_g1_i7:209-865(-)
MGVSQRADGNLTVSLTHGTKCHQRSQPFRQTTINMYCDPSRISSEPAPFEGRAEHGYCNYEFEWSTIHACPVCKPTHFKAILSECTKVGDSDEYAQTTSYVKGSQGCNHLALAAEIPHDSTAKCTPAANIGGGGGGGGQDGPWYKSAGFLITVIVLSSTVFVVVAVLGAVKYYKVRRLYEAYAQLDKDRGISDDFSMVGSQDMELDMGMGGRHDDGGL